MGLKGEAYSEALDRIVEPECLCMGLGSSTLLSKGIDVEGSDKVTVCPGPNMAYFSKVSTLNEMVDHIYGRLNLLNSDKRPHMFVKELSMYLEIFTKRVKSFVEGEGDKKEMKQLEKFQQNILSGVDYYKSLFSQKKGQLVDDMEKLISDYPVLKKSLKV